MKKQGLNHAIKVFTFVHINKKSFLSLPGSCDRTTPTRNSDAMDLATQRVSCVEFENENWGFLYLCGR